MLPCHASAFLQKPFAPSTMVRAVRRLLDGVPDETA